MNVCIILMLLLLSLGPDDDMDAFVLFTTLVEHVYLLFLKKYFCEMPYFKIS